jgi:hypothetical protein
MVKPIFHTAPYMHRWLGFKMLHVHIQCVHVLNLMFLLVPVISIARHMFKKAVIEVLEAELSIVIGHGLMKVPDLVYRFRG